MSDKTLSEQSEDLTGHNGASRRVGQDDTAAEMITVNKSMAMLYAKLARVMGRLNPIVPDGVNAYFKYPYQTAGAIANAVRVELAAENVAFLINMVSVDQSQKGKTKAVFHFTFACGDTGATLTRRFEGEAEDGQDKGINKVATAATKYFLIKTFLISPADEVDPDMSGGDAPKERPAKPGNSKSKPTSNAKSKTPAPPPPVETPDESTVKYDLTSVVKSAAFMYDHPDHAANSIAKMVEVGEIEPGFSTNAAIAKVMLHRAESQPYAMPVQKVCEALTVAMEAEGSAVPIASVSQWVSSGKTIAQAWDAVKTYHENNGLKPAKAKKQAAQAETDTPF